MIASACASGATSCVAALSGISPERFAALTNKTAAAARPAAAARRIGNLVIPALPIAAPLAQRVRFVAVGFMVRMCLSPSLSAVRLVEIMSLTPFLKLVIWSGLDIRPIRLFGINKHDRKQWQAEITHFPEEAIQRGLIDHRASQDGCSVACVGEAHVLKRFGPPDIKVSLEANLILSRLVMILR